MSGQDITRESQVIKTLGIECEKGVMIVGVDKDGPADKAGLTRYDIITALDDGPVETVIELQAAGQGHTALQDRILRER